MQCINKIDNKIIYILKLYNKYLGKIYNIYIWGYIYQLGLGKDVYTRLKMYKP